MYVPITWPQTQNGVTVVERKEITSLIMRTEKW